MIRPFSAVLIGIAMLTVSTQGVLAGQMQQRSTWNDLSSSIQGMEIQIAFPDGTTVRGQVLDVRADELVIDVRRTSNARLHAKGRTGIPRPDVSVVEVFVRGRPERNPDAGAIGAGLGAAAVSPLLFYLGETNKTSGWAALAIAVGASAGGAVIANHVRGRSESVVITVVQ